MPASLALAPMAGSHFATLTPPGSNILTYTGWLWVKRSSFGRKRGAAPFLRVPSDSLGQDDPRKLRFVQFGASVAKISRSEVSYIHYMDTCRFGPLCGGTRRRAPAPPLRQHSLEPSRHRHRKGICNFCPPPSTHTYTCVSHMSHWNGFSPLVYYKQSGAVTGGATGIILVPNRSLSPPLSSNMSSDDVPNPGQAAVDDS